MAKSCRYTVIALSAAFALYIVSVMFLPALFTDLLAPICDFYAAGLVFYAIHTSKNKEFRLNFIIAGLALLSWALADLCWLIYAQALGIDPGSVGFITALYFGTNLFLVILTIHYLVYRLQKWDKVQLIIDAVTFSLAMLWLMWVLLLNKDAGSIGPLLDDTVTGSASIILDVFQLTAVTIWYLSIRKGVIPVFLGLLAGAVFSYSLLDLVYYYLYAHDMYVPNSYIDALYLLTLFGIAVSVKMYYVKYPVSYNNANQNTNIGRRHKSLWLILFALLIMVFKGIDAYDVIFYLILLLFHEGSSTYIQNTLRNKELLAQEVTINKKLEMLVSEKTNDLKTANDELWQRNEDLRYINLHDPLTGLNNRIYFLDRLENAIKNAQPNGKVALVLWNVDNLKGINDTYGHFTGDKILI
ncbi:MAG: diguanylate cyclase, partial [Bacillota bacterium]